MVREYWKVLDRSSDEQIGEIPLLDKAETESMLQKSSDFWHKERKNPSLPSWRRSEILNKVSLMIIQAKDSLALQIAKEGGKPLRDSLAEVMRASQTCSLAANACAFNAGREIPMRSSEAAQGRLALTFPQPMGLVFAISAFNHPLNLVAHQIATAIAAGCPVLLKPAAETPLSALQFLRFCYEAGLPSEWAQSIACNNTNAEQIATSKNIAFLSFIGSAKVGWNLRSKLAPGVRCALEHGGAAPVIVESDCDLDSTVESLVKGGYYHSGQVCVSVQRVFVHKDIAKHFLDKLNARVEKLKSGDAKKPDTDCGPLIRKSEVNRVAEWVQQSIQMGAKAICGAQGEGNYYAPTVLTHVPPQAKVMQEEIFGPVICVNEYDDFEQAIDFCNQSRFSFQAALFSNDINKTLRAAQQLNCQNLMVNDHTAFRVDWMPFGGLKESGLGLGGVEYSVHELTNMKMVILKSHQLKL